MLIGGMLSPIQAIPHIVRMLPIIGKRSGRWIRELGFTALYTTGLNNPINASVRKNNPQPINNKAVISSNPDTFLLP